MGRVAADLGGFRGTSAAHDNINLNRLALRELFLRINILIILNVL